MRENSSVGALLALAAGVLATAFAVGWGLGAGTERDAAVKAGVAEYYIDPGRNHSKQFRYLPRP